jgi:hypothetical protein
MSPRHVASLPLSPRSPARGVAMVMVVACLATFSLIGLAMLRGSLIARGQFRSEHHLRQVELLLDAAEDRARLHVACGKVGDTGELAETIDVAADAITGSAAARIRIEGAKAAGGWLIRTSAEYPLDDPRSVRRSRELLLAAQSQSPPADTSSEPEETQPPEETLP